jgi:hypothetical protein
MKREQITGTRWNINTQGERRKIDKKKDRKEVNSDMIIMARKQRSSGINDI